MTRKSLHALMRDQFKVGAQAEIAVVNLGSGLEAAIGGDVRPDIVVWSSSSSVYAGFALNGSIIKPQPEDDQEYYGRKLGPSDVVFGHRGVAAQTTGCGGWQPLWQPTVEVAEGRRGMVSAQPAPTAWGIV